MRKYRIFTSDLGFWIYKKFVSEDWKITQMWFLDWKGNWTLNKDYARTFYHRADAEGVYTVIKTKDAKKSD